MPVTLAYSLSKHTLVFLLLSIGLITLPHVWHIPASLFVFFVLLLIWRYVCIWRSSWLPNRLMLTLVMLVGLALVYSQHQGIFGRDAGTSFFVVALALKLLEVHGRREIYLVVFLAFVVAASQFFYEQSIFMAVYILLVCTLLFATLIIENSRQSLNLGILKSSLIIVLQALPIAFSLFVLFPRLEAPRWLWLEDNNKSKSGLGETLEPGSISALSLSDELVFRAKFVGEPPPPKWLYWRGPVYSLTDGIRWMASTGKVNKINPDRIAISGRSYDYSLLMEPQKQAWVFALDLPEKFDENLERNSLYQLISKKKPGERSEYRISSYPIYNTGALATVEFNNNLQLPEPPSEKIINFVKNMHGFESKPDVFIANIFNYFSAENFRYTLTPPLMPEKPIETFLFDTQTGFCSHYATAFVYLMRVAGIPARVIGGYQGGDYNKLGGFLEIRQADAHAWAEVWLDSRGWVRFDPTTAIAPERIEHGVNIDLQIASRAVNFSPIPLNSSALLWLKRGRQLWQSVDYNWQRWIINYNTINQSKLLTDLGMQDWLSFASWLAGIIAFFSILLGWLLLKRKYCDDDKVMLAYRRFCRKMAKGGIRIRLGEGAIDFARRAVVYRSDLKIEIEQITSIFIRLRFEEKALAGDLQLLSRKIKNLRL